jgi:mannose-6-phosphate isomerase-like protein (cupin superfamily)
MRRLITAIDANGKSVFVHDGPTPEVHAGAGFELGAIWSASAGQTLVGQPVDAALGKTSTVPVPGATLFTYVVIPPEHLREPHNIDGVEASTDFHVEDDGLMHTTNTIDYGVLVQGELWLELDDGQQRLLRSGDCFVQNGTRHAWHNRGDTPAVLCVVMLGASRGHTP